LKQACSESAWWLREGMKETVLNFADDTPLDWYPVSRKVNNVGTSIPTSFAPRRWSRSCLEMVFIASGG
jgi:hypothetical protein